MTIIVYSYLITEIDINLHNLKNVNHVNKIEEFQHEEFACGLFGSIDFGCSST